MADPIQQIGSTRRLVYDDRDFYGAETPAQTITDFTGFNEIARFTRDVKADLENEHFANGVHDTQRIFRALVDLQWRPSSSTYSAAPTCYMQDGDGEVLIGSACFTSITRNGAGDVTLVFASPFPTTTLALLSMTGGASVTTIARTWLYDVVDASTIRVYRRQWTGAGSTTVPLTDGDFLFGLVHGEDGTAPGMVAVPDILSADCAPTDEHWKLARGSFRGMRDALIVQHAASGKHLAPQIAQAAGIFQPVAADREAMNVTLYAGSFTQRPRLYERSAGFLFDVRFRRPVYMVHASVQAESGWTDSETLQAAQCAAFTAEGSDRTTWRVEIGGITSRPESVRVIAFGLPGVTGAPGLPEFEHALEADTSITPDALAPWPVYGDKWLQHFGVGHLEDGEHNDRLVPVASVHVQGDGTIIETKNVTTVTRMALGRYRYELDITMDGADRYCAIAWPVTDGELAEFAIESQRSFTKTATDTEVEIFDETATKVDREHVVHFYGLRDGAV